MDRKEELLRGEWMVRVGHMLVTAYAGDSPTVCEALDVGDPITIGSVTPAALADAIGLVQAKGVVRGIVMSQAEYLELRKHGQGALEIEHRVWALRLSLMGYLHGLPVVTTGRDGIAVVGVASPSNEEAIRQRVVWSRDA